MEEKDESTPVEAPRGSQSGRVDDKGRLKLSADIEKYLKGKKLFITSFDGRIARIYPVSVWHENEALLGTFLDDPEAADALRILADDYGGDAEVDNQGRVLMPAKLRREMEVENQPVTLRHEGGVILVYSQVEYETRIRQAKENVGKNYSRLKRQGLK